MGPFFVWRRNFISPVHANMIEENAHKKFMIFTEADVRQIEKEGLSSEQALAQIDLFERGVRPVKLNRPCTVNDG
ncbi:MAG: hypothetical protein ACXWMI_05275, partial [Syntrophales bacterium]